MVDVISPPLRRAALYLRQSLDRAEGIETQRERCAGLARAKGWLVVATYQDNEVRASGVRGDGTEWHTMLGRIGQDFEIVIAVDLDRLVRSTKDLNKLIDLGAQVVTVDGEIDLSTADGEFRATMIAGIAGFETRRASERQKRHKAARALRGDWHGGHPPYGYRAENGQLVPEPSEVERIKEAARRLLVHRDPLHAIIADWNEKGIQTRKGKYWRQATLRAIMLNRAMLGETVAGVVGWEPIIDREAFERLSALITPRALTVSRSPGQPGGKYTMGSGLSVCAKCGKPLVANTTGKTAALRCLGSVHGPSPYHPRVEREVTRNGQKIMVMQDTGRVSVGHDLLECYVFEQAVARLNDTEYWHKRRSEHEPDAAQKIADLTDRRNRLADRRSRVLELYEDGDITATERRDRLIAVAAQAGQIANDIQALVGAPHTDSAFGARDNISTQWQIWTPRQRRTFLTLLIDRVVVHEWPQGMPRRRPRILEESAEDHAAAHEAMLRRALATRITIEWRP